MRFLSWFLSARKSRPTGSHRVARAEYRPFLEALEDRCLLNAGGLDPTFGSGGIVSTSINATTNAIVIQPNNDIVIAGTNAQGNLSLARYTPNGSLDTTFGAGGVEVTNIAGAPTTVALYPTAGTANDGKIVVIYGTDKVERFNANGSIDTSFGSNGVATVPLPESTLPLKGLVIQANGDIVVSGESDSAAGSPSFIVTRLNTNGTVDTTFATKGTATVPAYSNPSVLNTLAIQADGKLVVAGCTGGLQPSQYWEVARLNTDGALDTTFNSAGAVPGTVTTHMPPGGIGAEGAQLAIYPSTGTDTADYGKIVLEGLDWGSTVHYTAIARYNVNGTPDTTFGQSGLALTPLPTGGFFGEVAIQSDGKIVVAASTALQRYNTDGSLDTTFGSGGMVMTAGVSVAIQSNGRIVMAGDDELSGFLSEATGPSFTITGPSTFTADTAGTFTLTTQNPDGSADTGYSGTVQITSSDPQAVLPGNVTITGGTGTFNVTLETAGPQSVTATDTTTGSITGSETGIAVTPAAASQVVFTAQPTSGTAGQTLGTVQATLEDAYGNVETADNSDTVTLSINSGPSTQMGGTLTATVQAGVASFSSLVLNTSGTYTLSALANVAGVGTLGPVVSSSFAVASPVSLAFGSITYSSKTGLYSETLTLTNTTSGTLTGPISVELTNLPSGVVQTDATGTTNGNPYYRFLTSGKTLKKSASTSITLTFTAASLGDITFGTEVVVGL